MFSVNVVKKCPVTEASRGVITFDKAAISMIAGAVRDSIEWIVLLNGSRSDDGFEVTVERITVPQQRRGGAHAELVEQELAADVVGVMHSHHRMGAFFSSTDENTLNPRFPSSVVVAIATNNLGFAYEAEGKVKLPCGSVGRVKFHVGVRDADSRFQAKVVRGKHTNLNPGDCDRYEAVDGEFDRAITMACGLSTTTEKPTVFGLDGESLLSVIEEMTLPDERPVMGYLGGSTGQGTYRGKGFAGLTGSDSDGWAGVTGRLYERGAGNSVSFDAEIDMADKSAQYTFKGGCDWCEIRGVRLRWDGKYTKAWLCGRCWPNREDLMELVEEQEREDAVSYDQLIGGDEKAGLLDDGSVYVVKGH